MEIILTLSEREAGFLRKMAERMEHLSHKEVALEDAVHECIRDSMFDEGEVIAEEEFER